MGMDINQLSQLPEHLYIMQLMEFVQQLPEQVQKPIRVRDASAFNSFLSDSKNSFFKKYLVLHSLNEATYLDPDHRYNGEHYVSATPLEQPIPFSPLSGASNRSFAEPAWGPDVCRHNVLQYSSSAVDQRRARVARAVQSSSSALLHRLLHRKSLR
jgi:hypothetical protein